jgi:AcrR family transcriptional regulator
MAGHIRYETVPFRNGRAMLSTRTSPSTSRATRPRSPRVDRAIRDATLALFAEGGFDGMSVDAVAARAGVGKAAIYRRWPTKEDTVLAAIADAFAEPAEPDTGTVRGDLVRCAEDLHRLMTGEVTGGVFPPMSAELAWGSRLGRAYAQHVVGPRRELFALALRRGVERGELPVDVEVELAVDVLVGTLLIRRLTSRLVPDPASAGGPASMPENLVDLVLAGLRHLPS